MGSPEALHVLTGVAIKATATFTTTGVAGGANETLLQTLWSVPSATLSSRSLLEIHCWGDIGFTEPISMFLVGSALAVGGQLAVTTGAWPTRPALADVERVA